MSRNVQKRVVKEVQNTEIWAQILFTILILVVDTLKGYPAVM